MFGFPARILLTLTALAPVMFTYSWATWDRDRALAKLLAIGGVLLVLICIQLIARAQSSLEEVDVEITGAEAADRENIAFLLLYVSPLFADNVGDLNWSIFLPVVVIFGLVVATGYNYHFSPLLGIMGWHAYKISTKEGITYVMLTRRELRTALGPVKVRQLTEYVLIEFKRR
ncbi:hypothetical protein [Novosphingobium mathurense]|uniref:hypothetical protein n=1 Tax=Novosphingobium mathurense TaxID=428990 RepID=UPI001FEA3A9F|nr:hypothetical protein [Novosphingobium mathurense]